MALPTKNSATAVGKLTMYRARASPFSRARVSGEARERDASVVPSRRRVPRTAAAFRGSLVASEQTTGKLEQKPNA